MPLPPARVHLDCNRTIGEVSPFLFGGFAEHFGRCIYGGLYEPQSPLAGLLSQPGLLAQLAAMSHEQLLDLLRKVTGAESPQPQSPATGGPRFHLIQIPQVRRPGGGS